MIGRVTHTTARRGFTLIEILIVLAIVLLLAGLVAVSVFGRRADIDITKVNLHSLRSSLDLFRLDYRRFPNEEEGLAVLWDREQLDPEADTGMWAGYLPQPMPADQWGNAWGYTTEVDDFSAPAGLDDEDIATGPQYDLWSNGPDGEEGTDDDIRVGAQAAAQNEDDSYDDLIQSGSP